MEHPRGQSTSSPFSNAEKCTQCGYCLPVCPTYRVENNELHSPRGRVSVILALRSGRLSPEEATQVLDHCLLCQACHAACPADVRPGKLALQLRVKAPLPPTIISRLLHTITDRPQATAAFARLLQWYQHSGLQKGIRRSKLLRWLPSLAQLESLLPAARPGYALPPAPQPAPDSQQPRIALLAGCMNRLFFPSVATAACHVLHKWGFQGVLLDQFGCCGAPYRESGDRLRQRRQAQRTLDLLDATGPWQAVVCDSSICAVALRSTLRLFSGDPIYGDKARQWTEQVYTLSQFLANKPAPHISKKLPFASLAYHDHCQARQGLGIIMEPRTLLRPLSEQLLEVRQMQSTSADGCCGAAGEYQLRHPQRSHSIRAFKLQAIQSSGVALLTGENPGCLMHLAAGLEEQRCNIVVRHLAEILYEAYCT
ncbi:(Fe-S)-binding protein [Candidatus Magnetaquicoccus inordinatus]|uniref:(Fe-S)-binding protein n=1 Tax=Candidatus Magnetaquicoccus inordinatus TaxID=2496818 RepID=UPI00187D4256|nr:(Fe-S)-binding protein [Candidatus Magnetaquicoccus inordinatus]